jgi:signal transduction histidine kinase
MNAQTANHHIRAEHADMAALESTMQSILRDSLDASQTIRNIASLFQGPSTDSALVDLPSVIKDVLLQLEPKMHQHAINTHLSIDPAVRLVNGNRLQIRQVLRNLLTNAIESMEHNCDWPKDLEVKVSGEGGMVLTEIADRGHGVSDCERVFDAFFTTKKKGTGMGLRICKIIVEAHAGRLWASARRDRGTVFAFSLPLAADLA